jgi:hypothetical protein
VKVWSSGIVTLLGVVVTVAGCIALYNFGIAADETGISGFNPALWVVLFTGSATAIVGIVQLAHAPFFEARP